MGRRLSQEEAKRLLAQSASKFDPLLECTPWGGGARTIEQLEAEAGGVGGGGAAAGRIG
jgi:hypothetical protein